MKDPYDYSCMRNRMEYLGMIKTEGVHDKVVGSSNYADFIQSPWSISLEYDLCPIESSILKRLLRTKAGTPRIEDYQKIQHEISELIRRERMIPKDPTEDYFPN